MTMDKPGTVVVVGGTCELGKHLAQHYVDKGYPVVVTSLDLVALHRDDNKVREYKIDEALKLVTLKLVGYTECVHVLASKMREDASILIFGGLAAQQPYPGSTTITTVNGGVSTLINSLALELSPIRVNAIHPGQVG